jgi:hypothetical protein
MTGFPFWVRSTTASGQVRYRLGDQLVDRYLEFVGGRARPNTLRAVAFDLKTFFVVVGMGPRDVTPADVYEFFAKQRGDRSVVRLSDRESALSARAIARRPSSVSGPLRLAGPGFRGRPRSRGGGAVGTTESSLPIRRSSRGTQECSCLVDLRGPPVGEPSLLA